MRSMAATYVSSSRTSWPRFREEEEEVEVELAMDAVMDAAGVQGEPRVRVWEGGGGEGEEIWRGEWPGERSIVDGDRWR